MARIYTLWWLITQIMNHPILSAGGVIKPTHGIRIQRFGNPRRMWTTRLQAFSSLTFQRFHGFSKTAMGRREIMRSIRKACSSQRITGTTGHFGAGILRLTESTKFQYMYQAIL